MVEAGSFIEFFVDEYKVLLLVILAVLVIMVVHRVLNPISESSELALSPAPRNEEAIAEADLLLAYGEYDGAGRAIRNALVDYPSSADLVLKLLEIHFASGNDAAFLELANSCRDQFGRSVHWESIREMGQTILPDERLFR